MSKNKLILEFTEFNAMRLNPDSAQMSISVDNPSLSIGAFDKHEDSIRVGISKINSIIHNLMSSSNFGDLKSKLSLDDQKLTSLKVLKVFKTDYVNYVVYISFVVNEVEYYGEIQNVLSGNPIFKSEIFKDNSLIQTKDWVIRIKGLIVKSFKKWIYPEIGYYRALKGDINCFSVLYGTIREINEGDVIKVIRSSNEKIFIKIKEDEYFLNGDNLMYFNWWFVEI
jgi:hypothetical protein